MKIIELLNAKNAFDLNCKYGGDMQLAFKVIKFIKAAETEAEFYNTKYSEILSKYAEKDENGNVSRGGGGVKLKKDSLKDFATETEKLNSVEVETPDIRFTLEELNKCDLTGGALYALFPFIEEA